jgi:hypothetical protein
MKSLLCLFVVLVSCSSCSPLKHGSKRTRDVRFLLDRWIAGGSALPTWG